MNQHNQSSPKEALDKMIHYPPTSLFFVKMLSHAPL